VDRFLFPSDHGKIGAPKRRKTEIPFSELHDEACAKRGPNFAQSHFVLL
jgi:hypothetical protein